MLLRTSFALALFVSGTVSSAIEPPAFFSGKSSVKEMIEHFRQQFDLAVQNAGVETRVTLAHGFQLSQKLIDNLQAAYAESLDLTFDQLDEQQQKLFRDSWVLIESQTKQINQSISDAVEVGEGFNTVFMELIAWSNKPVVVRQSPRFVAPTGFGAEVLVRVEGFKLLGAGSPKLTVGTAVVEGESTNNEITFVVPRDHFPSPSKTPETIRAKVSIPTKSLLKPWTYVWPQELSYGLVLTVLPDDFVTYEEFYSTSVPVIERSKEPRNFPDIIAYGDGGSKERRDCFNPTYGWEFDTNTAALPVKLDATYRGIPDHRYNKGGLDFDWRYYPGSAKSPDKICIVASAIVGAKEETATTRGHLSVYEVRRVSTTTDRKGLSGRLGWGGNVTFLTRPGLLHHRVEVQMFGGAKQTYSLSTPSRTQFLNIDPDPRADVTILSAKAQAEWR